MVTSEVYVSDSIVGQYTVHVGTFDSCFAILNVCSRDNWHDRTEGRTAYMLYEVECDEAELVLLAKEVTA